MRRVDDYWAKDLPVNVGRNNFDSIRYDYYRDGTIALEAFKAGAYDIRYENVAKNWAIGYDGPALAAGLIKKQEIPNKVPQGMQAFGFNTRKPLFADARVRRALGYLFDFEWANKNLFYGAYTRTNSYFANSDFASSGLPTGAELAILDKFRGKIPDEVFTQVFAEPTTDGSGNIRDNLRQALRLLAAAGWTFKNEKLVNAVGRALRLRVPAGPARVRARGAAVRAKFGARRDHHERAHHRSRAIRKPHAQFRFRHVRGGVGRRRSRPATSSATIGARPPPTSPAAPTMSGSRARRSTRSSISSFTRSTVTASLPPRARSTACCCTATTSCRTGTSPISASPTGTSSARPPTRRPMRWRSTPGGSIPARASDVETKKQQVKK